MIRRVGKLTLMMARPPVVAVLIAFAAVGLAAVGHSDDLLLLVPVSIAVTGYFVNATVLNDLSDVDVDRVNLGGARGRPLVSGDADRRGLVVLGVASLAVTLAVGAALDPRALAVLCGGAVFNVAYSVPPVRLSARGVLAPLLLPVGFVAVPFLVAVYATGEAPGPREWWLLGALWFGFTGRIVLKDFRDVLGDDLYGKRTFILRHGARTTCGFSAACWTVSVVALVAFSGVDVASFALLAFLGCALWALRALAREDDFIAQQVEIGAVAVAGRGIVAVVLAHLVLVDQGWVGPGRVAVVVAVASVLLGSFRWAMSRRGSPVVLAPY